MGFSDLDDKVQFVLSIILLIVIVAIVFKIIGQAWFAILVGVACFAAGYFLGKKK